MNKNALQSKQTKNVFQFSGSPSFRTQFLEAGGMFDLNYFDNHFELCSTAVLNYVRQQL